MDNTIVFDIETDGLCPTKIHVMSLTTGNGVILSLTKYKDIKNFFARSIEQGKCLIGHNIQRYDIPAVEKILGIKVKNRLIDTLALSWYLFPDRKRHGLEQWGAELGVKKPEIADWQNLKTSEYKHRCESDVKINVLLWDKCFKKLMELYEEEPNGILKYLEFKMDCAKEQENSRWKLDEDKATKGLTKLNEIEETKIEQLRRSMPKVEVTAKRTRPAKPYKKDGSESSTGERWFKLLRERSFAKDYIGVVEVVTGYKEPNPTSHKQRKDWLYSLGWKPETFDFKRDKLTGDVKKIPQVSLPKGEGLCPSIKKLYGKEPALELLDGLSVVSHRITILKGFIKNVDDEGYLKAEVQGLTNTLRFKHSVIVNLPGVDKAYGDIIRDCLVAPEGYELCGSDMCSLEDTTKQHYMFPHDPKYVRQMQAEGFDSHLDLALTAGALTEEEVQAHKDGTKKQKRIRSIYKEANYACVYGAGGSTIARAAGIPLKEGKALVEVYWGRNWAVRAIPKEIKTKKVSDGSMWLLNPVSKFWYSLRAEKDIFSTLNQGTGVYCFDTWVAFIRGKRPQLTGQFHDEIILQVKSGNQKACTALLKWAIKKTNEKLKLNTKLDIDVQYGDSYAEIH